jgi:hypothetical protein
MGYPFVADPPNRGKRTSTWVYLKKVIFIFTTKNRLKQPFGGQSPVFRHAQFSSTHHSSDTIRQHPHPNL